MPLYGQWLLHNGKMEAHGLCGLEDHITRSEAPELNYNTLWMQHKENNITTPVVLMLGKTN